MNPLLMEQFHRLEAVVAAVKTGDGDKVKTLFAEIEAAHAATFGNRELIERMDLVCCRTNSLNYIPIDDSAPIRPRARPILARISSPVACHR